MAIQLTRFYVIDDSYYTTLTGTFIASFFGRSKESDYPAKIQTILSKNPNAYVVPFSEIKDLYWQKMEAQEAMEKSEAVIWEKIDPSVFKNSRSLVKNTFKILDGNGFFSQEKNQMLSFYFQRGGEFFTALFPKQITMPDLKNSIASI